MTEHVRQDDIVVHRNRFNRRLQSNGDPADQLRSFGSVGFCSDGFEQQRVIRRTRDVGDVGGICLDCRRQDRISYGDTRLAVSHYVAFLAWGSSSSAESAFGSWLMMPSSLVEFTSCPQSPAIQVAVFMFFTVDKNWFMVIRQLGWPSTIR
jgi:hypothetical protein